MYKSLPSHLHPYSQQIISLGKQDHYKEVCFPTFHLEAGSPYPLDLFSVPAHPVSVEEGSFSHLKRNPLFTTSSCYFSISVHSLFSFNAPLSLHAAPFPQIYMYPQTATTLKKKKKPTTFLHLPLHSAITIKLWKDYDINSSPLIDSSIHYHLLLP